MEIKLHASVMILDQSTYLLETHVKYAQHSLHPMPMILTVSALLDIENKDQHVYQTAQLMPHLMPQVPACAVVVNSGPTTNATNHQSALIDQHSTNKHHLVFVTIEKKTSLKESASHADKIQYGITENVYVQQVSSVLEVYAEHAIQELNMMVLTVSANWDTSVTETYVLHAINHAANAQVLKPINVNHAQM